MKFVYPAEIAHRTLPKNLIARDMSLFSAEFIKELPEVYVDPAQSGFVIPSGHLFTKLMLDSRQFNITTKIKDFVRIYIRSFVSLLRLRSFKKVDIAFFITNSNSMGFFHWFLDVFQKLEFISDALNGEAKDYVFIIPADHQAGYIIDSLQAFDFTFILQKRSQLILVDHLTLIPDIAPTGNYRKEIIITLRERMRSRFLSNKNEKKRIYITRKNAKKRKIINEIDLMPILQAFGFKFVDMDSLGFMEQVDLMYSADVLVSLHGAGLTHMLWIENPGFVLEIRARDDAHNNCYFTLASDLGLSYYYVLADKINPSLSTQQADYIIDPKYFKRELVRMLKHQEFAN